MDEDILDEQRELVSALSALGWEVTEAEVSVYQSPWEEDTPEATVTLTASKAFPEVELDRHGPDDEDDENPFRYR
jgi:hypothetical protein